MSLLSVVAAGRAAAESRMASTCTIRRKTGETTTDARGLQVPAWEDVYTGPCRVGGVSRGQGPYYTQNVEQVTVTRGVRYLNLPVGTDVRDGDLADVTGDASGVWQVLDASGKDQSTAVRVPVQAADRPTEWGA